MAEKSKIKNYNLAIQHNFKFDVADTNYLNHFVQQLTLPSINNSAIEMNVNSDNVVVPGNTIDWGTLTVTFLIDEDYHVWQEVFDWLTAQTKGNEHWLDLTRTIQLHILNANKSVLRTFVFEHAFPISMSSITFDSAVSDAQQLTLDVDFRYQFLTVKQS